jgi:hypothetical protein
MGGSGVRRLLFPVKMPAGLPVARMRSQPRGDRDRKLGVACVAEVAFYGDKV